MSEYNWFRVISGESFYFDMVGRCVDGTPKTWVLEFPMNNKLGGLQRVQFYKSQLDFDGSY